MDARVWCNKKCFIKRESNSISVHFADSDVDHSRAAYSRKMASKGHIVNLFLSRIYTSMTISPLHYMCSILIYSKLELHQPVIQFYGPVHVTNAHTCSYHFAQFYKNWICKWHGSSQCNYWAFTEHISYHMHETSIVGIISRSLLRLLSFYHTYVFSIL